MLITLGILSVIFIEKNLRIDHLLNKCLQTTFVNNHESLNGAT